MVTTAVMADRKESGKEREMALNTHGFWMERMAHIAQEYVRRQVWQKEAMPLPDLVEILNTMIIRDTLRTCGGSQKLAALRLGLKNTTLHEKMKRLGVKANEW